MIETVTMTLAIRPAEPEDAAALLSLLERQAAFEGSPGGVAITEAIIRSDGFGAGARFEAWVAERGGAVTGVLIAYQAYSSWAGAPTLVIHDLFVEQDARGSGAGRALVTRAARRAVELGCCRIDVNVLGWNTAARAFYEHLGFQGLEDWIPYRLDFEAMNRLTG